MEVESTAGNTISYLPRRRGTSVSELSPKTASEKKSQNVLKAGAIGSFGVAALGAVMMAPALGIYANLGLISGRIGIAALLFFLLALLRTLPTAFSYALIAREIPSAGSAYTWLSEAINPFVGFWMGMLLLETYLFCVILQPIVFGVFFNRTPYNSLSLSDDLCHFDGGGVSSTLIVASLAYPGIQISAKAAMVVAVIEVLVVLALSSTIWPSSWSMDAFPLHLFFLPTRSTEVEDCSKASLVGLLSFVGFWGHYHGSGGDACRARLSRA